MKRILFGVVVLVSTATTLHADQSVRGHIRKDGTYVAPHHKSSPNQNRYDNYSSKGNSNPYTGERGSQRNEFSNPPEYNSGKRKK